VPLRPESLRVREVFAVIQDAPSSVPEPEHIHH
jgi:hypothetical protein